MWKLIKRYLFGRKDRRFEIVDGSENVVGPDLSSEPFKPILIATPVRGITRGQIIFNIREGSLIISGTEKGSGETRYEGKKNITFLRDALIEAVRLMEREKGGTQGGFTLE